MKKIKKETYYRVSCIFMIATIALFCASAVVKETWRDNCTIIGMITLFLFICSFLVYYFHDIW